jgi:hypothetical protein
MYKYVTEENLGRIDDSSRLIRIRGRNLGVEYVVKGPKLCYCIRGPVRCEGNVAAQFMAVSTFLCVVN